MTPESRLCVDRWALERYVRPTEHLFPLSTLKVWKKKGQSYEYQTLEDVLTGKTKIRQGIINSTQVRLKRWRKNRYSDVHRVSNLLVLDPDTQNKISKLEDEICDLQKKIVTLKKKQTNILRRNRHKFEQLTEEWAEILDEQNEEAEK